ncbi:MULTISPECIES: tryptophan synthase subunit alpha [unclassified Campylobacter]|uniref:tryptophan synthase subunit alpha n=1 Tax=unclassified Campylobacter TaxID=2593542 RepID=UPI0022E9EB1E|nr:MULTISPECIES: tryptophan synthase subunit alpha [unclassified Campylobacter]MDA3043728.1 tryptophan synthase subunit alpha [Campylobacter sp. JMF_09 ED2]MDA3045321.1 tryptophan synthase subunit alpha [Campylobacter sp. JMF_07 ED4]MDA3064507.1 tryptophan synthase subunit alpha [Campylobacter sp. JMF_11 EL3]MDA3072200.1 tryptophan synthase subunit alpha [Campylobacter sp. VBCF_03 NA9]MDA3075595.1 tryptophan synthase subunit alpha [Campylobacter sp. JMF_05 ED3]
MDKIASAFKGKKPNIGYIVAGYPSVAHTKEFLSNLDAGALDLLEIGIPYSDPIADGKDIFNASFSAVQNGVTTDTVFEILGEVKTQKPLVFLVYYNLIFAYGVEKFIEKSAQCGISGFIIPDLPYEENEEVFALCQKFNLALIPLISVTSEHRATRLLSRASGFIYGVGAIGVTGTKQTPLDRLKNMVADLHKMSDLPVAIGFGIRTKENVSEIKSFADGAIIGTAIVNLCAKFSGAELQKQIANLFE